MIGIAVLGAGRIGKIHAGNVAANSRARLIAVADPFAEACEPLAAKYGAEAMTDPMAAIARDDVDAVVIGTPTDTHIGLLTRAVELGKAVLCEKPIDLDLGKSTEAAARIDALKGRVMLAFNRRFDPTFAEVRRAIDAGQIGAVRQVVISSRDPGMPPEGYVKSSGGLFRDMTIHDLDMARWLLGEEPVSVTAMASPSANITVVEVVGARLSGQASGLSGTTNETSAALAMTLSVRPVIVMNGMRFSFT